MKLAIPNILKKQHFGADHQVIPQTEPLQGAKKSQPKMVQREKQRQSIDQLGGGFKKEQITPTWGFPKIRGTPKWMVYNGKPY